MRTCIKQHFQDVEMSARGGPMQAGVPGVVRGIDLDAVAQQQCDELPACVRAGQRSGVVQRRPPVLVPLEPMRRVGLERGSCSREIGGTDRAVELCALNGAHIGRRGRHGKMGWLFRPDRRDVDGERWRQPWPLGGELGV